MAGMDLWGCENRNTLTVTYDVSPQVKVHGCSRQALMAEIQQKASSNHLEPQTGSPFAWTK